MDENEENSSKRKGNAAIHGITDVNIHMIAYAATIVSRVPLLLSSCTVFHCVVVALRTLGPDGVLRRRATWQMAVP